MLAVRGVEARFGDVPAVTGADLDLGAGELLALLGPSGCGKSTLLRAIAGLEPLAAGTISVDGDVFTAVSPEVRPFGLRFQDLALFPHRIVGQKVEFGLRMNEVDPSTRRARSSNSSSWSVSLATNGERSRHSRAERRSVLRSLGRSLRRPGCCCSTNRSDRSTVIFAIGSSGNCPPCSTQPAPQRSMSRTIMTRRSPSGIVSVSCTMVGCTRSILLRRSGPPRGRSPSLGYSGTPTSSKALRGSRFGAPTPQSSTRPGMSRRRLTGCTFAESTTTFVCGSRWHRSAVRALDGPEGRLRVRLRIDPARVIRFD